MSETENKTAAIVEIGSGGALMPRNFEGLWRMSQIMAASGMMPKGMERTESVFVAVQMGLEVGLSPMQAVQNIAAINGRPAIWGDAMLGLVRGSGLLLSISETFEGEGDAMTAVCAVGRKGDIGITEGRFSIADAKRAGLWGKSGPWTQYPRRMLQMRARGFALRDKFADVLKGLYAREELEDEQYMGAAEVVPATDTLADLKRKARPVQVVAEPSRAEPDAAEPAQEPAGSSDWPREYKGNWYDCRGVIHDPAVHSGGRTCNRDGTWRRAKGIAPERVAEAEARYPHIDPATWDAKPADAPPPLDLAPKDGPDYHDVLEWIESAQTGDELDTALEAGKDVEMSDDEVAIVREHAHKKADWLAIPRRG
jgi:hypothetical protein